MRYLTVALLSIALWEAVRPAPAPVSDAGAAFANYLIAEGFTILSPEGEEILAFLEPERVEPSELDYWR